MMDLRTLHYREEEGIRIILINYIKGNETKGILEQKGSDMKLGVILLYSHLRKIQFAIENITLLTPVMKTCKALQQCGLHIEEIQSNILSSRICRTSFTKRV